MAMSFGWSLGPVWYHPTMCSRAVSRGRERGGEEGGERGERREGQRGGRRVNRVSANARIQHNTT